MIFSHEFWIQIAIWVFGVFVFIAVNSYKISQWEAKLATKEELREKVKERNSAIDRVYERFDEFKKMSNDDFVRKDMCGQLHTASKEEMKRLDEDYKNFRHEIRNTVQKIYDSIDELRRLIIEGNK